MSITAHHAGLSGSLAVRFAKGQDEFFLPLLEAEPFYATLRIRLTFSGSRTRMDGTSEITEAYSGYVEETFARVEMPIIPLFGGPASWGGIDEETGEVVMDWQPDGATLGDGFPTEAGEGNFCMALALAGKIYDGVYDAELGLPPDPKKPRHRYRFESSATPTTIGERTTTPEIGDPDTEDIEWQGVGMILHAYSDDAGEDWETNRIGHNVFRLDIGAGAVIDFPTTGWTAAEWRDQRREFTGSWEDDDETWDSSSLEIAAEVELS
jgi:hypothetical protein